MENSDEMKLHSALQNALQQNDFQAVKNIVQNDSFDVNWRDVSLDLQSLVMKLCYVSLREQDVIELFDIIFDKDPDLNLQDGFGRTAIMHACIAEKFDLAEYLVSDPTTKIEIFDFDGNSVLTHAVRSKNFKTVKRLLEHPNGYLLLDVYNSSGQRPVDIAEKYDDAKLFKLLKSYQKDNIRCSSEKKTTILPPTFSPQNEAVFKLNSSFSSKTHSPRQFQLEKQSPRSTYIDDETPNLYLTPPTLRRKQYRKSCENVHMETTLPAINSKCDGSNKGNESHRSKGKNDKTDKLCPKSRERRNSISLPDLRDTPGGLVASGGNTPTSNYDYSDDSDFSDDVVVDICFESPRKKSFETVRMKRSVSEKQIGFPKLEQNKPEVNVKRTLTEGNVYSNNDSKLNRLKLLQKSVLS